MKLMNKNERREIERIVRLMQTDDSYDAPPDAIRWSKNIFLSKVAAPKKSVVERILAVLQINLSPNRAAFGERSASASQARQMLFQAGENALDIRIVKTEKGFDLRGQILGESVAGCAIKLGKFETAANELGEFKVAEIPDGIYELSVKINKKEIVVENLKFK